MTATFRRLLAPWCAALLLASCGNFLESDQSNDNQTQTAPPDGLAEEELNTEAEDVIVAVGTTDNTTHTSHTQVLKLSDPATGTFVVHDNATSFLLSAFSDSRAQIVSLTSPSGREELAYLDSKAAGITSFGNGSYDNYLVPMRPDILPEAGTWRYEISGANDVRLTLREDLRESDNATLLLQPYLTTSAPSDLSTVLARIAEIYTQNELSVTIAEPLSLSTQYAVVSSSFSDTTTQTLLQQGRADAVNIFLVDDFQFGGVLGIAAGIPGSLGIASEWNGVLVSVSAHQSGLFSQRLDTELLAETVVHEAGHLLGLWHPTEEDGTEFDPLDDTPECDLAQFDTNSNGSVSAEECLGQGAENIMFWTSWPDGNQETFSEDQRFILRRSPLAFQGQLTEQTGDDITLTYDATLAETVANNASTVQSIQDMVELYDPECQRSTFPQTVDLILAQGCVSFQQTHYRPAYLPANLDNLNSVQDYVAVVNQNDRFSYYFEPVAYEETTQSLSGARSYIGFSYAVNDSEAVISASNPFVVDAIFPYTRAWWDGLRVGDQITAVDGVTISGLTVAEVRALLPSAEAEATVLTIARDGAIQTLETASETHLSRRLGTNNQIAYLNLREYTTVSGDNVRQDFEELLLSGSTPEALILDLRQNGGGSLLGALELTDYLGNASVDGEILFTFQTQSGGTPYRFGLNYDSDAGSYDATTLVVLTDGGSASASEVTSAALQDWNLATIMGDATYGKGVGQSVVDLLDGSGVFITSFELLSPKGDSWHEVGVIPDQRVEGAAPSSPAEDTVLAAAIEFLETGALVSASRASRLPSEQMLEVPVSYTRPWDGGSRERLQ